MASLFDGIAGFPRASSRYGISPLWASEIEKFPIEVTKQHFPHMRHHGDITKINGANVEPVDIITFGSPCQDLSVAGKRAGLEGERSGLFMDAIRVIREMRKATNNRYPRFAVWENVPGAFSSNKGEGFRAIIEELCKTAGETVVVPQPPKGKWSNAGCVLGDGYTIAWRVLDAQYWGVPQRRRRIFLVADFGGESAPEILFKPEGVCRDIAESREAGEGITPDAERGIGKTVLYDMTHADEVIRPVEPGLSPTLNHRMGTGGNQVPIYMQPLHDPSPALDASYYKGCGERNGIERQVVAIGTYQNTGVGWWNESDIAQTLRTPCGGDSTKANLVGDRYAVRRLTPLECERLQGFPDNHTNIEGASDTARYKALGNSVAIPCVEFVMKRIKEAV